jgi:hypothetical protein
MKRILAVVCAGILLAGCGSISLASSVSTWGTQSSFRSNTQTLLGDMRSAQTTLANAQMTAPDLHTVCAVLLTDSEAANASLPTPDNDLTSLLSNAYGALGSAATTCYNAAGSPAARARALGDLARAGASLAEATARYAVVRVGG